MTEPAEVSLIFFTESLILAQNERWRHGLGMQVERDFRCSNIFEVQWRKGEEHVSNLPLSWEQPRESGANTECG